MTGNGDDAEFGLDGLEDGFFVREPSSEYETRPLRDFRDLRVFAEGRVFVKTVYSLSAGFPKEERFGLTDQLRRASVSIIANIAEGNGRQHAREYVQFLSIAIGSARECQALLIVAEDLGFSPERHEIHEKLDRVVAMLHRLREAIGCPRQ